MLIVGPRGAFRVKRYPRPPTAWGPLRPALTYESNLRAPTSKSGEKRKRKGTRALVIEISRCEICYFSPRCSTTWEHDTTNVSRGDTRKAVQSIKMLLTVDYISVHMIRYGSQPARRRWFRAAVRGAALRRALVTRELAARLPCARTCGALWPRAMPMALSVPVPGVTPRW